MVDEVECIEKWGTKFRPEYDRLGELRVWSPDVPFLGVTTTLTADALSKPQDKLFLSDAYLLRMQDLPTNIRFEVHTQPKNVIRGLRRLLGDHKTIVYFEHIYTLLDVRKFLLRTSPDLKLGCYYSERSKIVKAKTMAGFMNGNIQVLLATEAASRECDLPDVAQVIQYG